MSVRSKMLKIRNLPKGHRRLGSINTKPIDLFIAVLAFGVVLIAVKSLFIGTFLIAFSLYNILFIRGDCLAEFYDDFVVFYHVNSHKDECYLLKNRKHYDELIIGLKNNTIVRFPCVSKIKLARYFRRYAQGSTREDVVTSKTM